MSLYDGFPKTLRIGHYDYKIEIAEKVDEEDSLGSHLRGDTITLKADQGSAVVALDTALHEINHAILDVCGIITRKGIHEESLVVAVTSGWIMVYRDNPELCAWIYRMIPPRTSRTP